MNVRERGTRYRRIFIIYMGPCGRCGNKIYQDTGHRDERGATPYTWWNLNCNGSYPKYKNGTYVTVNIKNYAGVYRN